MDFKAEIEEIDGRLRSLAKERENFIRRVGDLFDASRSEQRIELLMERERLLDARRASWSEE